MHIQSDSFVRTYKRRRRLLDLISLGEKNPISAGTVGEDIACYVAPFAPEDSNLTPKYYFPVLVGINWTDEIGNFRANDIFSGKKNPFPRISSLKKSIYFSFSGWLSGGADEGEFPHFGSAPAESAGVVVRAASAEDGATAHAHQQHQHQPARPPVSGDVLLEVAGQKVAGYTAADVAAW